MIIFHNSFIISATPNPGILITGNPGTGKTAFILQLVEFSCFGRRKNCTFQRSYKCFDSLERNRTPYGIYYQIENNEEKVKDFASSVVAYHFCQADNNSTCLIPDFIHSLAAQLCQAPQLSAYRNHLLNEPHLQHALSMKECIANPNLAFTRGILEPLHSLETSGKIENSTCVILIDALCEAEYHRSDCGDTIMSFLAKHITNFPSWLKIIATIRSQFLELTKQLPFTKISLDDITTNENIQKDMIDYIDYRINDSPSIKTNITSLTSGKFESGHITHHKFTQYLLNLSQGSFLFTKLTLDLLERGHLVAKSTGFKVIPVSLAQIYLLHFNLRFPTTSSFEYISRILSVCLAALYPLTLLEIYYSVNSLAVDTFLTWNEFLQKFKLLSGFIIKRLDNTYMFFHPSFREWLIRRDVNESSKFLCDLRVGHAGIAFRLSRVQILLNDEKTLELGHHILKAHLYKNTNLQDSLSCRNLQAFWVAESSEDVSSAVCSLRNIYNPNVKVSRLLLLAGASPNHITDFLGNAPALCMFASEGMVPMVSLLLEFGADVDLTNNQGLTALALASSKGHCDVVRQLIAAGASLGQIDTAGYCPLTHATRSGCLKIVSYLLASEWITKSEDDISKTDAIEQALVAAAGCGYVDIVEYLLDMSETNINCVDKLTGETALTISASKNQHIICSILIDRGANVFVTNTKKMSPLLLAIKSGHLAVVDLLLQYNAAVEDSDSSGRSALMLAASEGYAAITELLLKYGKQCIIKKL